MKNKKFLLCLIFLSSFIIYSADSADGYGEHTEGHALDFTGLSLPDLFDKYEGTFDESGAMDPLIFLEMLPLPQMEKGTVCDSVGNDDDVAEEYEEEGAGGGGGAAIEPLDKRLPKKRHIGDVKRKLSEVSVDEEEVSGDGKVDLLKKREVILNSKITFKKRSDDQSECSSCGVLVSSNNARKNHILKHALYRCRYCSQFFINKEKLELHKSKCTRKKTILEKDKERNQEKTTCRICGFKTRLPYLYLHMKTQHLEQYSHKKNR